MQYPFYTSLALWLASPLWACPLDGISHGQEYQAFDISAKLPSTPPATDVIHSETINGRTLSLHSSSKFISLKIPQSEMDQWNNASSPGFNNQTLRESTTQELYKFVKDDFDFIFYINNNASLPTGFPYYGELISVRNGIQGINKYGTFDDSPYYGSKAKLQSVINLPYLNAIQQGPTLHELAHNWANFFKDFEMANPSGNYAALPHWGWTGIPGQLGGFDPKTLVDLGGGNWQANNGKSGSTFFGGNANGGNSLPYANWELYLMGMMPQDSLKDITYFTNVVVDANLYGQGKFSGTKNTYTVQNFLQDYGPRNPSFANSQKQFKCLFVVLSSTDLSSSDWSTASTQISWLTNPGADQSSLYNFYEATRGNGTLNSDLSQSLLHYPQITANQPKLEFLQVHPIAQGLQIQSSQPLQSLQIVDVQGKIAQVRIQGQGHQWSIAMPTSWTQKPYWLRAVDDQGQVQLQKLEIPQD